jgi:hypothetical protein
MEDPRFKQGFKKYLDNVRNNSYIFEVSKCCGYSEIVPTFKNATCADLYRNVMCQFDINVENKIKVYATITESSKNILVIQNDKTPIRNIILENASFFKPIYPLPTTVVYNLVYKFETEEINCSCNYQK